MKHISFVLVLLYTQLGFAQSETKFTLCPSISTNYVKYNSFKKEYSIAHLDNFINRENKVFNLEAQFANNCIVNATYGLESNIVKNKDFQLGYSSKIFGLGAGKQLKINSFLSANFIGKFELHLRNQDIFSDGLSFLGNYQFVKSTYVGFGTGLRVKVIKGLHLDVNGLVLKNVKFNTKSDSENEIDFRVFNQSNRNVLNIGFGYTFRF